MADQSSPISDRPETNSKVGRLIEEYGLTGLGEELEAYWEGTDEERFSLRELADHFNRAVLKSAMESEGTTVTDYDVEHIHTVLTDSDVSSEARIQKRRELEREGVDVDGLYEDFVSHQAIHTYLREYRGAKYEKNGDGVEGAKETLQRLRSRTTAVTERTIDALVNTGELSVGSFDVFVDIRVHCHDCGGDYDVVDILKQRGCDC